MSLRDIYSKIIKRVEDKRKGLLEEQQVRADTTEQLSSDKKEKIQRELGERISGLYCLKWEKSMINICEKEMNTMIQRIDENYHGQPNDPNEPFSCTMCGTTHTVNDEGPDMDIHGNYNN